MEFASLLFFCVLLRASIGGDFRSSMVYFLLQSLSSMGLLLCFLFFCSSGVGLVGVFVCWALKIGIFPFNLWYFFSLVNIQPLPFFLALTFQKLPSVLILQFVPRSFWASGVVLGFLLPLFITLLFIPSFVRTTLSLTGLIIFSSIFNNLWMLLAFSRGPVILFFYFTAYTITLYFLITTSNSPVLFFTLIGLPPFPLFFIKIVILFLILRSVAMSSTLLVFLFLLLLGNSILLVLYFRYFSSVVINVFKTSITYF